MNVNQAYRSIVLAVANRPAVRRLVTTRGRSFARRFVAGETRAEALAAVERLEAEGIHGILDLLGETVAAEAEARSFATRIAELIEALAGLAGPRYVSVKLSQLGQDLRPELALANARAVLDQAGRRDCFIRLDMEDSAHVDSTLAAFRALRAEGRTNVGLVLQSYLKRTEADLADLLPLAPDLRIVKGAYKEPAAVAFQSKRRVDEGFERLVRTNLKAGNRTAIATHDERLIERLRAWIAAAGIARERTEFQMLYGIRRDLQRRLAGEGETVRAYIPYGTDWYPYFSRRIAERPANLVFVLRSLLKG